MKEKIKRTKRRKNSTFIQLKKLSPKEWIEKLKLIKGRILRYKIACIVWWDFFSKRSRKKRCQDFDKYVDGWKKEWFVEKSLIRETLQSIGYSKRMIKKRIQDTLR